MIKYICDKCRKEVQPEELFEITLKTCFGGDAPAEFVKVPDAAVESAGLPFD